ncbi:hypothetical protein COT86_04530 [Candidatus Collierbacteria bacterium CG10_big_fil_rev_8_21_14_0_10_43_36]|uniref:Uncharacterized protein n=3 Tax=Candidatus Collieribacteriota TaxID=1752725 RepID=A0A2H0DV24_9BACT|nr:hypothetical protein [bacterium]PIP85708.1 MAG: hypothetical protein COW83_02840 [Candidatus Collierbacteria bacterium CG22_combo_CG10-13_8_21_14_all_43_12]PIR99348.1 MAG: hypothetical protein COT86_04530 [Candidatus Collierbacteria bacterium CG10_big_fil_rev_8_21_14_0_10_43_36]PIZ24763.1 MAG: hypothetical protein COY48_01200 [Candidatus Collierbacteria bacterium CG_4_10_14_0_8_um_filter_43_86]PJB47298.1 MAG: hypothetical protein CO104_03915 [Candidatus Collierbacteria bacterium CG_4_9_14_3_
MKGQKMDLFWTKIIPECVAKYPWGGEFTAKMSLKRYQEGIKSKIKAMDENEFDLFLAAVVMQASRDQMMGVNLTEKVGFLRGLRA